MSTGTGPKRGVELYDIMEAFITVVVGMALVAAGFWIYNSITGTLWRTAAQTEKDLKSRGVEKDADGVWRIKTGKTMSHEAYADKTQRAFLNAAPAISFGTKSKKKSGKTE
ncbi:hypothetical protein FRB93_006813 [Tulasnella sp. JGI-2019a]|nr:hypothetical protein FRB93_006813 [Tulasnella sp. JGI-2019a]